mgnify:CR=1 FL=1
MKRMLLLTAVLSLLASCTQEASLTIESDVSSFQFDAGGGEFDAVIFTNGYWTATCEDQAVTVTPSSGDFSSPVHIKVGSNEENYTKVIRITLNATLDALTRTGRIVVTQQCRPFIFCDASKKTVGPEGGLVRWSQSHGILDDDSGKYRRYRADLRSTPGTRQRPGDGNRAHRPPGCLKG